MSSSSSTAGTVRTYQKRGTSRPKGAADVKLPLLPPAPILNEREATPPWRRRARKGLDAFEEDENETSFNSTSREEGGAVQADQNPPPKAFFREFRKALNEDRDYLEGWVATPEEFNERNAKCVPADWSLNRQMRFAAWCQLLGLDCKWEGGYLWVLPTKKVLEYLVWIFERQKQDANLSILASPLPAAPMPRALSLATVQSQLARLDLSENSILSTEDESKSSLSIQKEEEDQLVMTTNARNRVRKWQVSGSHPHQSETAAMVAADLVMRRLSSGTFDRRSSLGGARRSSLGGPEMSQRASATENYLASIIPGRRSANLSLATAPRATTGRRTSIMAPMQSVKEDEEVVGAKSDTTAKSASWQDLDSADALRLIFNFLPPSFLLLTVTQVSKRWNSVAVASANALFAASTVTASRSGPGAYLNGAKFFKAFPQAKFLAEGAYKSVYRVHNPFTNRDEAISVMDVNKIAKYGDVAVVAQEVNVSLVLSELLSEGVCPNFIETSRVFQLNQSPPLAWTKTSNGAASATIKDQPFQYIRMEFCQGGDLEEHMKTYPGGILPLEESRGVVFQMLYSLYAGRRTVKLRHYDVKCLNFFCRLEDGVEAKKDVYYSIGQDRLVKLPEDNKIQIKLADYGTADLLEANMGKPVDVCHFTTLENTPIDFLLFPDAQQSYAADTFQLGLAVLHVLTGAAPYEEIMEQVRCPTALMDAVSNVWESDGKDFDTLRCVLRDDDDNVLYHTLYRYLVLFGLGAIESGDKSAGASTGRFHPSKSKVFEAVVSVLGDRVDISSKSLKAKNIKQARKQFAMDSAKFSLRTGSHHLIARARDRGKQLRMWDELVLRCLDFSPECRISAQAAIRCKAFEDWYTGIMPDVENDGVAVYGDGLAKLDEETDVF